ncbi:hypothetical protein LCGC14_2363240 [marine sediment metagenome]|uniref:Uncharacterized protein n=1 Tax=marine sediment metagenome TaxID=412755 RepID=A0A0F9C652_9ZZZZ
MKHCPICNKDVKDDHDKANCMREKAKATKDKRKEKGTAGDRKKDQKV